MAELDGNGHAAGMKEMADKLIKQTMEAMQSSANADVPPAATEPVAAATVVKARG
jgi:hypothetical protein